MENPPHLPWTSGHSPPCPPRLPGWERLKGALGPLRTPPAVSGLGRDMMESQPVGLSAVGGFLKENYFDDYI